MYTLADAPVLEARILIPRIGAWTVRARVEIAKAPTGSVVFTGGGLSFTGTVVRSRIWRAVADVLVVGGAGGLSKTLAPKDFRDATIKVVLKDTLDAAGEALSSTSDSSALATNLPAWVRASGSAGMTLRQLADVAGAAWRVLPDGSVWFGAESWPEQTLVADVVEAEPSRDRELLRTDRLALRPGVTFRGRRVERVEHNLEPRRVRTVAIYGA